MFEENLTSRSMFNIKTKSNISLFTNKKGKFIIRID